MERANIPGWRSVWRERSLRWEYLLTLIALAATLLALTRFLEHVESRPGVTLPDPLLALVTPRDVTWLTFSLIYAGLLAAIVLLARQPDVLLLGLQTYVAMVLFRIGAMYLLPLDPPPGMIPLRDPFVEYFGTGRLLTRDLFFSGHTATLFLLALVLPGSWTRKVYVVLTAGVALCVLVQHVHYSVDIFVAPFVTYVSYRLALCLHTERRRGGIG